MIANSMIIGSVAVLCVLPIWLFCRFLQIRYFNRRIYSQCALGYDCAVGIWRCRYNHLHYVLVAIDKNNQVVALKHYDNKKMNPKFHALTQWNGYSLYALLQSAKAYDRPVYSATVRAMRLLSNIGSNRALLTRKLELPDIPPPTTINSYVISKLEGFVIAPNINRIIAENFFSTTVSC